MRLFSDVPHLAVIAPRPSSRAAPDRASHDRRAASPPTVARSRGRRPVHAAARRQACEGSAGRAFLQERRALLDGSTGRHPLGIDPLGSNVNPRRQRDTWSVAGWERRPSPGERCRALSSQESDGIVARARQRRRRGNRQENKSCEFEAASSPCWWWHRRPRARRRNGWSRRTLASTSGATPNSAEGVPAVPSAISATRLGFEVDFQRYYHFFKDENLAPGGCGAGLAGAPRPGYGRHGLHGQRVGADSHRAREELAPVRHRGARCDSRLVRRSGRRRRHRPGQSRLQPGRRRDVLAERSRRVPGRPASIPARWSTRASARAATSRTGYWRATVGVTFGFPR